jgi:glutaredoxin
MLLLPALPTLRLTFLTVVVLASSLASTVAGAQTTTYSWIDPKTGVTVISDQPPPPGAKQILKRESGDGGSERQVPYATRQAAEKFPVVLYTSATCTDICKQARDLLNGRGVPFSEKMLASQEEINDLEKQLGSAASVPSIIVGRQNFKGFESGAWNNLLDLAGYPKSAAYGSKPSGAFAK